VSPAAQALTWGTPIAVLACFCSWAQRRAWRRPPRTQAEAARRAVITTLVPYSQLGVRVGADGFVYSNATGKCRGQLAGARAVIVPRRPVHTLNPSTGWAVIYFADGTHWKQMFPLRNLPEARAQAERFNGTAQQQGPAVVFRRTRPRPSPAGRP
jgi:hypothetical protein